MEIYNISKSVYHKLNKLQLDRSIFNTEAEIFVIPSKNGWNKNSKLLKKLYCDQGDTFGNKLLTVNALIDRKDIINIDEMVLPESIAIYNKNIIGFTMPYIKNINFELILKDPSIKTEEKRRMLIEIGEILEKMKNLRNHKIVPNFYINDLHEANFIYNLETQKINVIDLDSSSIAGNKPFAAKYLTPLSEVAKYPFKYKVNEDESYPGYILPDENSDIYCYNLIVLNHLYGDKANHLDKKSFYLYLNYLDSLKYDLNALLAFEKMYLAGDNESVASYIKDFPTDYETVARSRKAFFERRTKSK